MASRLPQRRRSSKTATISCRGTGFWRYSATTYGPRVQIAEASGLAVAFAAGVAFMVSSLRSSGSPAAPQQSMAMDAPIAHEPDIYWPMLLDTGERSFDYPMRLQVVRELGKVNDDWRIPILLCAREQECDPQILHAIDRALRRV